MRKIVLFVSSVSAFSAFAAQTFTSHGMDARSLFSVLQDAGTAVNHRTENAGISVSLVRCDSGYFIPAGATSSCKFTSSDGRTIQISGVKAQQLFSWIEKAGVARQQEADNASIEAYSINCSEGFLPPVGQIANCSITE